MAPPAVCVPMTLDACVLNPKLCKEWPNPSIAPITQPNYTFLRLDGGYLQPDVLPPVDLHAAAKLETNSRLTDLARGKTRDNRVGVYLHWTLPKVYRSGVSATGYDSRGKKSDPQAEADKRMAAGFPTPDTSKGQKVDDKAVSFRGTPSRWLVIRRLDMQTVLPEKARSRVEPFHVFLVESDLVRNIENLGPEVDLEIDVSPFIMAEDKTVRLDEQGEIFIGKKHANALSPDVDPKNPEKHVRLSIVNSSNPMFADYCLHNSNVFSMVDDFTYSPDDNPKTPKKKLESATVSYQVIGWHSDEFLSDDPFFIALTDHKSTHQSRLEGCNMVFSPTVKDSAEVASWLEGSESTRTLCHGSIYNVLFSAGTAPKTPDADKLASLFSKAAPVAVGTTPLDSALAFVSAHVDPSDKDEDQTLLKSLKALQPLLLKQEETSDGQFEAIDMLSAHNFAPAPDSGSYWHLSGDTSDGQPLKPNDTLPDGTKLRKDPTLSPQDLKLNALDRLNMYQTALDQVSRDLRYERWRLWCTWWKYNSFLRPGTDAARLQFRNAEVIPRSALIQKLTDKTAEYQKGIDALSGLIHGCQKGARDNFVHLRDPTLLVSGLSSPWPSDFLNDLLVRLDTQLVTPDSKIIPSSAGADWQKFGSFIEAVGNSKVPPNDAMKKAMQDMMLEFFQLSPENQPKNKIDPAKDLDPGKSGKGVSVGEKDKPKGRISVVPLYHDQGDGMLGPRDVWQNQPWFPLFMEWEALYYHIDWSKWSFGEHEEVPMDSGAIRIRYGIKDLGGTSQFDGDHSPDIRKVAGRSLILPQPAFSFKNIVQQLINSTNPAVLEAAISGKDVGTLSTDDKKKLDDQIKALPDSMAQLQFLSAPLDGFTSHLTTQLQGTHIKPGIRLPGQELLPMPMAIDGKAFNEKDIELMGIQTATVPYTNHVTFGTANHSPFKPLAHGQFMFTKLNIIDKFGQAVSAINPAIGQQNTLFPVISEYYQPQLLSDKKTPIVVQGDDPVDHCRFVQMPPNINQDARLNAVFLSRDPVEAGKPPPPWRASTEWESPIWGFLVVNYVESGIQFFLPDGTFYAEARIGGVGGVTQTKWKPFRPKVLQATDTGKSQLDALLKEFDSNPGYLRSFIGSINKAMDAVPEAPASYADYLTAIIGKPLALVNTGWSLELAIEPLENMSEINKSAPELDLLGHTFPVKVGDHQRIFDGLIGLFDGHGNIYNETDKTLHGPEAGKELEYSSMYTYFPSGNATKPIEPKAPEKPHYLPLNPYHISTAVANDKTGTFIIRSPGEIRNLHNKEFKVIGALIDPFTAVHGYSGILPIASTKLPSWSVELALKKMTAFFQIGPILITTPSPQNRFKTALKIDQDAPPTPVADIPSKGDKSGGLAPVGSGMPIPAIQSADWGWLQPYYVDDSNKDDGKGMGEKTTEWNSIGIEPLDNKAKLQPGPYTAVEGYLQLKRPMGSDMLPAKP